jgi:hypothetical protein
LRAFFAVALSTAAAEKDADACAAAESAGASSASDLDERQTLASIAAWKRAEEQLCPGALKSSFVLAR